MHPDSTIYRLATEPADYARCHNLMVRLRQGPQGKMGFPTILALRDDRLLGFLSTHKRPDMIVAGPLMVDHGVSPITVMRLVEAYDIVLKAANVQCYYFTIEPPFARWERIVAKLASFEPAQLSEVSHESGVIWYKRSLADVKSQSAWAGAAHA